ncbi:MAG TPA: GAF and ANTAR domain-containing protein [Actinomycetota bacterium]
MTREAELSRTFVEMADTLVGDFDVIDFLHNLAGRCVQLLDVDAAGLMLADQGGNLRVVASSSEQARLLELFEVQAEEGPCLECFRTGTPVIEERIETSDRWPRFRERALEAGFRSVQAEPMRLRDQVLGALNLFRTREGGLPAEDISISRALAGVASIGLIQERALREARVLADHLQTALNNRVIIEQAKGVLAERMELDMSAAFERLRRHARNHNQRLAQVARDVVDGVLPSSHLR